VRGMGHDLPKRYNKIIITSILSHISSESNTT
jgi:hypothetical protein